MIATSGFPTALECTKFGRGSTRTHWGSLQRFPDLAGLRGPISKGEGEREKRGEEERNRPPYL